MEDILSAGVMLAAFEENESKIETVDEESDFFGALKRLENVSRRNHQEIRYSCRKTRNSSFDD